MKITNIHRNERRHLVIDRNSIFHLEWKVKKGRNFLLPLSQILYKLAITFEHLRFLVGRGGRVGLDWEKGKKKGNKEVGKKDVGEGYFRILAFVYTVRRLHNHHALSCRFLTIRVYLSQQIIFMGLLITFR